jgi:hypothetical protein
MALVDVRGFNVNPDIGQSILQGIGEGQQLAQVDRNAQIRQLLGKVGQQAPQTEQQQQLSGQTAEFGGDSAIQPPQILNQEQLFAEAKRIDPIAAKKQMDALGFTDELKRAEASRFAFQLQNTPAERRPAMITARAQSLQEQGRDGKDTLELLDLNEAEQNQALQNVQLLDLSTQERLSTQKAVGKKSIQKSFAPVTIINKTTKEKRLVAPVVDSITGKAKLERFDLPEGFEVSRETDEEKRAANIISEGAKAKQKVIGKNKAERRQLVIDRGVEAADSFANIQRAIDLLDSIKTGGSSNAILRAKQLFGIESADEAELSNKMSKAVLSQLRATFGAAFTATEGESLVRIEAGFGKSTEGNRRLLGQTKRIILRAANRAIRAAKAQGDNETVADIEESLKFRLDSDPVTSQKIGRFTVEVE